MKPSDSKQSILFAWYMDYHLFGYLKDLLPFLKDYKVTILTCDQKLQEQYQNHANVTLLYKPWLRPIMRLMDHKITRPIGWIIGWIWSFLITRNYDLVITPRDTKPFQHMITSWTQSLVIRPALGFDDKLFFRYKYGNSIDFPDIMQFSRTQAPMIDTIFGGNFLDTVRGSKSQKHYTVTGHDIAEFFEELGAPKANIYVTGSPNYENIMDVARLSAPKLELKTYKGIYALFSSQLEFSADELKKMWRYLNVLFKHKPKATLLWKLHPTMQINSIERLESWLKTNNFKNVILIKDLKGDENNAAIIGLCDGVFVEESNVGLLACFQEKPLFIINLSDTQNDNFFCRFDGILDCRTIDAFGNTLKKDNHIQTIDAQNAMLDKVCIRSDSPCGAIANVIDEILNAQGFKS